jgi:hypothetical protein
MGPRDRILAVERSGYGNLQRFGKRDELGRRKRGAHAAASDDDRPLRIL